MSLSRRLGKSKAKAALALSNPVNATLPLDAEARLQALEAIDHWHTNLTQLDKVRGFGSWNFFSDGAGVSIVTKTSNYNITTRDTVVLGDATSGSITLTLPNPTLCYDTINLASIKLSISKIDSSGNSVVIAPYATETIAGDTSFSLLYINEVLSLVTNGTNWYFCD